MDVFLELTSLETSLLEYGQYNLNRTSSEFNMSSIYMGKALSKYYKYIRHHSPSGSRDGDGKAFIAQHSLTTAS